MRNPGLIVLVLCGALLLAACASEPPLVALEDLPAGDAGSGEKLFLQSVNDAPTCASCHSLGTDSITGPGLEGIGERAGQRVDGQSAEAYLYYSIIRPSKQIVRGFSNVMYREYEEKLSPADIADLIAFLLEQ